MMVSRLSWRHVVPMQSKSLSPLARVEAIALALDAREH